MKLIIACLFSLFLLNFAYADEKKTMAEGRVYLNDFEKVINYLDPSPSPAIACFVLGELGEKIKIATKKLKRVKARTEIEDSILNFYGEFISKAKYEQREQYCYREWEPMRGKLLSSLKIGRMKLFVLTAELGDF